MSHEARALAKNAQKVQAVLDRCIDGVTLSQITGDTQLSSAAARAALKYMGAECEDGLWFESAGIDAAQPEPVTSVPELVTIAESAPVEPMVIDWPKAGQIVAPDDATHQNLQDGCFYKAMDGAAFYFSFGAGAWFPCSATADDLDVAAHVIRLPVKPKSGSIPAPKSETGIPVSEQKQSVKPELVSVDVGLKTGESSQVDWSKAPDGTTHYNLQTKRFYCLSGAKWFFWTDAQNAWLETLSVPELRTDELTPRPAPLKTLTQAVFEGLPPEYRWAAVDPNGRAHACNYIMDIGAVGFYPRTMRATMKFIGCGYDTTNWQNSMIERVLIVDLETGEPVADQDAPFTTTDPVNHPPHYKGGGIECIDAMQAMLTREEFVGYLRGNIFKYQWRYRSKNGIEDLRKADWYAQRLIGLESGDD